jgi:hypothetical protein
MTKQKRGGSRPHAGRKKTGIKKTSVIRINHDLFLQLKEIKKNDQTWTAFLSILVDANQ